MWLGNFIYRISDGFGFLRVFVVLESFHEGFAFSSATLLFDFLGAYGARIIVLLLAALLPNETTFDEYLFSSLFSCLFLNFESGFRLHSFTRLLVSLCCPLRCLNRTFSDIRFSFFPTRSAWDGGNEDNIRFSHLRENQSNSCFEAGNKTLPNDDCSK